MSVDSLVKSISSKTGNALCHDCEWSSKDGQHSEGIRQAAYNHTYYSGHRTTCEVVKKFEYTEDLG